VKTAMGLPVVLAAVFLPFLQVDNAEMLMKDGLQATQDLAALLKTVKDKDTAEAALPKLDAPMKLLARVKAGFEKIKVDEQEEQKLRAKFEKPFAAASDLLKTELKRLQKSPELLKICNKNAAFGEEFGALSEEHARATLDLKSLETVVAVYKKRQGQYPKTLDVLTKKQPDGGSALLAEAGLIDPWGQPYVYEAGNRHQKTDLPLIYSKGPPGQNMPIRNWE
jgi:hypothetical protein